MCKEITLQLFEIMFFLQCKKTEREYFTVNECVLIPSIFILLYTCAQFSKIFIELAFQYVLINLSTAF